MTTQHSYSDYQWHIGELANLAIAQSKDHPWLKGKRGVVRQATLEQLAHDRVYQLCVQRSKYLQSEDMQYAVMKYTDSEHAYKTFGPMWAKLSKRKNAMYWKAMQSVIADAKKQVSEIIAE